MNVKDQKLQDSLVALEKCFWGAAGSDGKFYKDHFADGGLMVLPFEGGILDKAEAIESTKQAAAWTSFQINNPRLLPIGETEVALIYEAKGSRGDEPTYIALISSVYSYRDQKWQLLLHQQTPLA